MLLGIVNLLQRQNSGLKAVGIVCLVVIGIIVIPIFVFWHFGSGKERFIYFFEGSSSLNFGYDDDDNSSISESEDGTTIGGSSVGGYEVKYKEKDNAPKGILRNRTGDVNVYGRDNSLSNIKSKGLQQQSKKRLRRSRTTEESNTNVCIQAVENCGVGA